MKITLVKKILADGQPCKKCNEVLERLAAASLIDRIDHVAVADERDPQSEGILLAAEHGVNVAPFFIVEDDEGNTKIYTIYFQFLKEVLNP